MLEGNILQLMQKIIRLLAMCDETTLFLITVTFSRKSQRKWCPAVSVYLSGYFHLWWLEIIFQVKCALREKSVAVLTYNSAVKCQSMSGGRWTGIWSERYIKVGLDHMRLLILCHFGNWFTADASERFRYHMSALSLSINMICPWTL